MKIRSASTTMLWMHSCLAKVLLGVLLTSLNTVSDQLFLLCQRQLYLGWLANFSSDGLPLVGFVFFDRVEKCLTLDEHQQSMLRGLAQAQKDVPRLRQTLRSACPIHVSMAMTPGKSGELPYTNVF